MEPTTITRIDDPIDTDRGPYTMVEYGDHRVHLYDSGDASIIDRPTLRRLDSQQA